LAYNISCFGEIMKTVELTLIFRVPEDSYPEQWVTEAIYPLLEANEQLTGYHCMETQEND
jgi:hypothetical protein